MKSLILDDQLYPNPPSIEPEKFYKYLTFVFLVIGVYFACKEDKDCLHLFTLALVCSCTESIIKEIKKNKNG